MAGSLPLVGEVPDEVPRGELVEAAAGEPGYRRLIGQRRELPDLRADRLAELGGPPWRVSVPERQLARLPGGGQHEHPVRGDVLDPPGARAEHEHLTDARLVDHLLVELTDAPRLLAAIGRRKENAEQPSVRYGPAAGHRELLRARPAVDHPADTVPDQARPQACELLARVP